MSVNRAILLGKLGKDPEVRSMSNGDKIASISLATSERWKDKTGEKQEKTEWHKVVIFGKLAEVAEKYLKKGDSVYFEGKIKTRKWQDNNGADRYSTEVVIDRGGNMTLLGGGKGASGSTSGTGRERAEKPAKTFAEGNDFGDEIPF